MRSLAALACAATLAAGCGPAPVTRRIQLAPAPVLPSGASAAVGTSLRVSAAGLEPLRSTARYVVWGVWPDGTSLLGSLENGASLSVNLDAARLASLREVRVTEEDVSGGPPMAPSGALRLQGAVAGPLSFVPVAPASLAAIGGEARADDTMLMVSTNLPSAPAGLSWGVWTRFPATGASAQKSQGLGGEPVTSSDGRLCLGTLDADGTLMAVLPFLLATMQEVSVVLQSARGQPATVSPVRALQGVLKLPEPSSGAESAPHTH